jgi:DNA segregation ATPase FtsK/SpoIIIE-like protein
MSNRDSFKWRPNDNSSTTLLRYDLEAKHWTKAFKSASINSGSNSGEAFMVIGMVISLLAGIVWLIILGIVDIINWGVKVHRNSIEKKQSKIQEKNRIQAKKQKKKEVLKGEISKLRLPKVNITERDSMFNKAAHLIVQKKEISITLLMLELKLEFERVCKLIDDLRLAGIISKYNSKYKNNRKVLIADKATLNLLFEIEKESV